MNINDLTIGEAKQLVSLLQGHAAVAQVEHPYEIGQMYAIRTVTMHHVGRLVAVYEKELVLEVAAWLADSGRWSKALETGEVNEVEPFPDGPVIIGRGSIVDAAKWVHEPLRVVK